MSFNVHQLLHACDCVTDRGPLWVYLANDFEDLNGKLLNLFNGTQVVAQRIEKSFFNNSESEIRDTVTDYICYHINCDENLVRCVTIQKKAFGFIYSH